MNDPHVIAVIYEIEHASSVDYSEAEPVDHEEERFRVRIEDKHVRLEMKEHHATEEAARKVVEPYIRSWELDEALKHRPGSFNLEFARPEIVDRNPTPGVVELAATLVGGAATGGFTLTVHKPYPKPPPGVMLDAGNPDVKTMFNRYEGYLNGREPLPGMAYFCVTMLEDHLTSGRKAAAEKYQISKKVLRSIRTLASTKGGPATARKGDGIQLELAQEEERFLEEAVKAIIRRVAEVAYDPHRTLRLITRADFQNYPVNIVE